MRRVPWTEGQRALVLAEWPDYQPRWCEAISTVRAGRRYWRAALGPSSLMVEATTAATRHLPDQCRTCHGFRCGCPGEGWEVPVHVRLPIPHEWLTLRNPADPGMVYFDPWMGSGIWIVRSVSRPGAVSEWFQATRNVHPCAGTPCPPCVPYLNGRPVWVDPWKE